MNKTKKYKSEALAAIHKTISDLFEISLVDKAMKQYFDEACLTPIEHFRGKGIRALREHKQVSQNVFAHYLKHQ